MKQKALKWYKPGYDAVFEAVSTRTNSINRSSTFSVSYERYISPEEESYYSAETFPPANQNDQIMDSAVSL